MGSRIFDEAADRERSISPLRNQEVEHAVRAVIVQLKKAQVGPLRTHQPVAYESGAETVVCQTIGSDHLSDGHFYFGGESGLLEHLLTSCIEVVALLEQDELNILKMLQADPETILLSMPPAQDIVGSQAHPVKLRRQRDIPVCGEISYYVYLNRNRVPMLTVGRVAGMTHANYPRESWIAYDEFFCRFSKTESGELLYMGRRA